MKRVCEVVCAVVIMAVCGTAVFADGIKIEKGKKVKFDYTLKVDGQVVETSVGKTPIEYVDGDGNIIVGLAKALEGMQVGEEKTVTVSPEEGYGKLDEKGYQEVPRTFFPADFKPEVGIVVQLETADKQVVPATIMEIKESTIVLNFNHPLAGKTLEFDVKIVSVE